MRAVVVAVALCLAACSEAPPPVTATRVLEVSGIQPVVNAVALSPDGALVVVGDVDGGLVARDVPSGAERWMARVHTRGSPRRVDGVFFSPDGSLLVTTGHEARTLELWDAATGRPTFVLDIGRSRGVAFHPTDRRLVVAAEDTLHVVDMDRGEVVRTLPYAHAGDAIFGIAFSGEGQALASISGQGSLKIWSWPALLLRSSTPLSRPRGPGAGLARPGASRQARRRERHPRPGPRRGHREGTRGAHLRQCARSARPCHARRAALLAGVHG